MIEQKRLVILGAGTGGTLAANRLRKKFRSDDLRIDIVDQDNRHVYQPGSAVRSLRPDRARGDRPQA